jgi:hypothetical protein
MSHLRGVDCSSSKERDAMKTKIRLASRRRRALRIESLEPRLVLDSGIGSLLSAPSLTHFESQEQLRSYLLDAAVTQYADLFEQPAYNFWPCYLRFDDASDVVAGDPNESTELTGGTNVQVAGVDEGDVIKTDGNYLYGIRDQDLYIVDIRDPQQLQIVSSLTLDSNTNPREIYLSGDRLTLISQTFGFDIMPMMADAKIAGTDSMIAIPWTTYDPEVHVSVYDISDRGMPVLLETTRLGGTLINSREVGSVVYVVTDDSAGLPLPETHCKSGDPGTESPPIAMPMPSILRGMPDIAPYPGYESNCVYETRDDFVQRWSSQSLDGLVPAFHVFDGAGNELSSGWLTEAADIYSITGRNGTELVSVVSFDVGNDAPGPEGSVGVFQDYVSEVYATQTGLYLASTRWTDSGESTAITKLTLNGVAIAPSSLGEVPGRLLNQFAMDEYQGYLRVATTQGWGDASINQLFVLGEYAGQLKVVGQLETGLAPGEQLYAARFLGDRAFLTTFRQVDPLFAIDLSDPYAPKAVGKLEIPGFSVYFQPISENLLLGFGRDADPETGVATGPQLTLFDISDLAAPKAVSKYLFENSERLWSYSEAFYNHHALMYSSEYQTLVLPMETSGWQTAGTMASTDPIGFQQNYDFLVFHIGTEAGAESVEPLGSIAHDSPARRSLEVGGNLFTIAADDIQVHPLLDPATLLGQIYLASPAVDDWLQVEAGSAGQVLDVLANDRWDLGPDFPGIAVVSEPSCGGSVQISADGRSLVYTPPLNFEGTDSFNYTVDGNTAQVYVTVQSSLPEVRFRLDLTDAAGNPLNLVHEGDEFQVVVTVEDLRANATGVFAAYLDIRFDATLAEVAGPIVYGDEFTNGLSGGLDVAGLIDELGAFGGMDRLGPGEHRLATIPMIAIGSGQLIFSGDPADVLPGHDCSVYDSNVSVAASSLLFVDDSVVVGDIWHNSRLATDTNDDGITASGDVLAIINFINLHGAQPVNQIQGLMSADSAGESTGAVARWYFDTNDDGFVSPLDALQVINLLNEDSIAPEGEAASVMVRAAAEDRLPTRLAALELPTASGEGDRGCSLELPAVQYRVAAQRESDSVVQNLEPVLDDILSSDLVDALSARDDWFAQYR